MITARKGGKGGSKILGGENLDKTLINECVEIIVSKIYNLLFIITTKNK